MKIRWQSIIAFDAFQRSTKITAIGITPVQAIKVISSRLVKRIAPSLEGVAAWAFTRGVTSWLRLAAFVRRHRTSVGRFAPAEIDGAEKGEKRGAQR